MDLSSKTPMENWITNPICKKILSEDLSIYIALENNIVFSNIFPVLGDISQVHCDLQWSITWHDCLFLSFLKISNFQLVIVLKSLKYFTESFKNASILIGQKLCNIRTSGFEFSIQVQMCKYGFIIWGLRFLWLLFIEEPAVHSRKWGARKEKSKLKIPSCKECILFWIYRRNSLIYFWFRRVFLLFSSIFSCILGLAFFLFILYIKWF